MCQHVIIFGGKDTFLMTPISDGMAVPAFFCQQEATCCRLMWGPLSFTWDVLPWLLWGLLRPGTYEHIYHRDDPQRRLLNPSAGNSAATAAPPQAATPTTLPLLLTLLKQWHQWWQHMVAACGRAALAVAAMMAVKK